MLRIVPPPARPFGRKPEKKKLYHWFLLQGGSISVRCRSGVPECHAFLLKISAKSRLILSELDGQLAPNYPDYDVYAGVSNFERNNFVRWVKK